MPNYANTQLYELIEHDEKGIAHVYRGHTTGPLRKRLSQHRLRFKEWKEGKYHFVSSFEVLKHGPARIELVRVVSCLNKKEAHREEGKFIRELPTCVNILKNYANRAEHYNANKETIKAKAKAYHHANKETKLAKIKAYQNANKDTIIAQKKKRYEANRDTILAYKKEKVTCECGAVVGRGDITRHRNTHKHIHDFIHC